MATSSTSTDYASTLIALSLSSSQPILRFGTYTLKSGRQSPYFFNFGLFNTGALLHSLTSAFADAILASYPSIGLPSATDAPEVLFGPAYKGIPLVAAISTELARRGRDVGYCYNRKEAKTHGEGGSMVGASLVGKRVLVVDDVITAGTAIREAHRFVVAAGGLTVGIVEALDREEKGAGELSTVQEVEKELGVSVVSVVKMRDIVNWLGEQGREEEMSAMEEYRKLPIYESPTPPATLEAAPSPLQEEVGQARRFLQSNYEALHLHARAGAQQWIGWENTAEAHVKAMLPEDEDLNPGGLYVGVATLAGSILARNRNILLRAGLPSAFFFASLSHFLPKTFDRVALMAEALERRYVPAFAGVRAQAAGLLGDLKGRTGL